MKMNPTITASTHGPDPVSSADGSRMPAIAEE
jgi:hypothetical protein